MDSENGVGIDAGRNRDAELLVQVRRGRRREAARKPHSPRQRGRPPIVVVYQKAADPPQRVCRRQRRRAQLHGPAGGHIESPAVEQHGNHAANEPAVPHQTAPGEERGGIPKQGDVPQLCPHDPADHGSRDDVAGVVLPEPASPELERDQPAADQKRDHHHDPVAGKVEAADPDGERINRHASVR